MRRWTSCTEKLYGTSTRTITRNAVQSDIKAIEDWSDKQLLQLNPKKCKFMILSRKRQAVVNNLTLYLGGTTLEEVETFKYLGILLSSNLSWSEHISGVCSRAKQVLGLLYRQFYRNSSSATLKQLYLTLVRPHLESAVGSTHSERHGQARSCSEICTKAGLSSLGCWL